MFSANSIVFVVDDDPSVRDALSNLLDSVGLAAQTFGSSEEFLSSSRPEVPSCLVLDAKLPGMSGPEFQEELRRTGIRSSVPRSVLLTQTALSRSKQTPSGSRVCWRRSWRPHR